MDITETIEIIDVRGRTCRLGVVVVVETLLRACVERAYKVAEEANRELAYAEWRLKESEVALELIRSVKGSDLTKETKDELAEAIWEYYQSKVKAKESNKQELPSSILDWLSGFLLPVKARNSVEPSCLNGDSI